MFIESHGKGSSIGVTLDKVRIPWADIFSTKWTMLRSSGVGFIAGILPGAGASLGSFLAYMTEKSIAGEKGGFGTGVPKVSPHQRPETMQLLEVPWCQC